MAQIHARYRLDGTIWNKNGTLYQILKPDSERPNLGTAHFHADDRLDRLACGRVRLLARIPDRRYSYRLEFREPMNTAAQESESFQPPKRATVILAMLVTVALGASVLTLLTYRALKEPSPSRVIVVQGNSDWDGAELTLEGGALKQPQETSIMPAGNYSVPFFVWPGVYTLHVKSQGVQVYEHQFNVTTQPSEQIDLAMTGATTLPATQPDRSSAGTSAAVN